MTTNPSYAAIVEQIRAAAGNYEIEALNATDRAYLESLDLPEEVIAFYDLHAPKQEIVVNDIALVNVERMREEHERLEPGLTLRTQGAVILAVTGSGDPYFLFSVDDGYRIMLGVDGQLGATKEETIANCSDAPSFASFAKLLEAFATQSLPSHD